MAKKNETRAQRVLKRLGACEPAKRWAGNRTMAQAWAQCRQPSWMCWLAYEIFKRSLVVSIVDSGPRIGFDETVGGGKKYMNVRCAHWRKRIPYKLIAARIAKLEKQWQREDRAAGRSPQCR